MRYYKIDLTSASGAPITPSSLGGMGFTSLLPNGSVNPAALNVELDIPVSSYHVPDGQAIVRIWGVGLQQIGAAFNLNGANIKVYGGMSKGLPLANPAQAGLLVTGMVLQAFGNWVGTDQTIDLILSPATGTTDAPMNFILNWKAGTSLSDALAASLKTALPNAKQQISVSPRLTQNHDEVGYYQTLNQFASTVFGLSTSIVTDSGYAGVNISYDGVTVKATDNTTPPSPKMIAFQDLIGQPTWIAPLTVQMKTVMRADITLMDIVTLPPGIVSTTAAAQTQFQDKTAFSGNFQVQAVHHYGNFRQPDAASWNTTFNLIQQPASQ